MNILKSLSSYEKKCILYKKRYYIEHKDRFNQVQREKRKYYKEEIFKILGNKCSRCGFDDVRVLQIDHIEGNGIKERRKQSSTQYLRIIYRRLCNGSKKYQLLCANCNWIKRIEKREAKHIEISQSLNNDKINKVLTRTGLGIL